MGSKNGIPYKMEAIMSNVEVWEEKAIIPTYEIGAAEKNRFFWISAFIREAAARYIPIL